MSYYARYKKSSKRLFSSNNPNDKSPKRFDIRTYLKDEFFNCDDIIFTRIADLYCKLYGVGAHNYMMSTFYDWKSGRVGISGQTFSRILECVPKFLSDEKRFRILKCEVIYFLDTIHYEQQRKAKYSSLQDVNDLFENYYLQIEKFDKNNLSWFLGKGIFTEKELEQFLLVCIYSLKKKLNLVCQQVFNDFTLLKAKITTFDIQRFNGNYRIDFLNSTIDINMIRNFGLKEKQFGNSDLKLDGIIRQYADRYIIDELIKLDYSKKDGDAKAFIKSNDLDILFSHFTEQIKGKNQIDIKSNLKGEGGSLYIELTFTPFNKILNDLTIAFLKIVGLLLLELGFLYLGFGLKNAWGFILGFYGGIFIITLIVKEVGEIKKLLNQFKTNV